MKSYKEKLPGIALRNVKKSRSDYAVYFFTLIIGVSVFYMFNALGEQGMMKQISRSGNSSIQLLVTLIETVSVMVAVVLGMLIIYANNFLIKRRKKEFGIYMLLGMSRKMVSRILIWETCIVGLVSLFFGLVIGVFGAQLLSILTARMFEVDLTSYRFEISGKAIILTVISFIIIFLVVLIFNTGTISRVQLIDLITAGKKNEKPVLKNRTVSLLIFLISAAALAVVLIRIGVYGKTVYRNEFFASIVLGIVLTFTLFWSVSGFIQYISEKNMSFYRKGLNSFVIRQFTGNINTSAISMGLITLLLFVALCFFSSGFSMRSFLNRKLGNATPVDLTMQVIGMDASGYLEEKGIPADSFMEEYIELPIYNNPEITLATPLMSALDEAKERFMAARWDEPESVMRLSDYNRLQKLFGREEVIISDTQYSVVCDFDLLSEYIDLALERGNDITVGGVTLTQGCDSARNEFLIMSGLSANLGVILVPDHIIDSPDSTFVQSSSLLAGNYIVRTKEDRYTVDNMLKDALNDDLAYELDEEGAPVYSALITTKNQVQDNSMGTSVIVVFLVLYIGVVFVISCTAILALKLLSDSIDSVHRFEILSRTGVGNGMMRKALFAQVFLNFMLPLTVAVIETVAGVSYLKGMLDAFGVIRMGSGVAVTLIIMLIVYGGYFITTYESCRKIIRL